MAAIHSARRQFCRPACTRSLALRGQWDSPPRRKHTRTKPMMCGGGTCAGRSAQRSWPFRAATRRSQSRSGMDEDAGCSIATSDNRRIGPCVASTQLALRRSMAAASLRRTGQRRHTLQSSLARTVLTQWRRRESAVRLDLATRTLCVAYSDDSPMERS